MNNEMNNLNNQNPNSNGTMENLNSVSPIPNGPVPTPPVQPVPNVENLGAANVSPIPNNPAPQVNSVPNTPVNPMGMPETLNNGGNPQALNQQAPVSSEPVNLQPAGVVSDATVSAANTPPEPLQAATLNEQTANSFNSQMGTATPNMNMDMNNTINDQTGFQNPQNPNNMMGAMGGVPVPPTMPEEPPKKNKKKMNTPLLIVLVVVLIAAIGFGVYYFLVMSRASAPTLSIRPKISSLELGTSLGGEVTDYADITGAAPTSCTLQTTVDTTTVGTYEYTVTCNGVSKTQTVEVRDTTAPTVQTKDLVVVPGATVDAEDFVDTYDDYSDVTFEFSEEIDTSAEGEYEVTIVASDEYDNQTEATATLTVSQNAPAEFMYCEMDYTTEVPASAVTEYRFGITNQGELYDGSQKVITYQFTDQTEFDTAVAEIEETGVFDGYSANIYIDEDNMIITVTVSDMTSADLATDFSLDAFPTGEGDIEALFENPCSYSDN